MVNGGSRVCASCLRPWSVNMMMYLVLVTDVNGKWWRSRMCIMSPSMVNMMMYLVLVTDVNGKWWQSRMCIMSPSTVKAWTN